MRSPGKANVGIIPAEVFREGRIGLVSRSGTLTYQIGYELAQLGLGNSTIVGIGGDPVVGSSFIDVLARFEADEETEVIVMVGEIGGDEEEKAARYIEAELSKPVVAYIAGFIAPPGKTMGHAGAIISGSSGTAQAKKKRSRPWGSGWGRRRPRWRSWRPRLPALAPSGQRPLAVTIPARAKGRPIDINARKPMTSKTAVAAPRRVTRVFPVASEPDAASTPARTMSAADQATRPHSFGCVLLPDQHQVEGRVRERSGRSHEAEPVDLVPHFTSTRTSGLAPKFRL